MAGKSKSLSGVLAVLLAIAALLVGFSSTAEAHDVLVGTSPADGSTTAVVPALVRLTLDQPALAVGTIVVVTGPSGSVQRGKAVLVGSTITQRLQPASPAGRYSVLWRATSRDGHPVSGKFTFTATSASAGQHATSTTPTTPRAPTTSTSTIRSTPHLTSPATVATALAPTSTGTSTPASAAGNAATPWWALAAGIILVLLGLAFLFTRRLRSTPGSDLDPRP